MKKLVFTVAFLILSISYSQNGIVEYTEIESLGAPGANLKAYNAALYFTPKKSLYVSSIDSLEEGGGKQITKTFKDKDGAVKGIRSSSSENGLYNILNRKNNFFISNARFNTNIVYKEPLPEINWQITKEEKEIEGISVTKATADFRGRKYIAWFAPQFPVPLGPWKLNGLPGLIIEAHDENKEILFLFRKLHIPTNETFSIPEKETAMDLAAFKAAQESNYKKNIEYMRAMAQRFDGTLELDSNEKEHLKRYLEFFE